MVFEQSEKRKKDLEKEKLEELNLWPFLG